MKKIPLISLLLLISLFSFSQEWGELGNKWHYKYYSYFSIFPTYTTIEAKGDTLLYSKTCKKMHLMSILSDSTTHSSYKYMYSENDSVFFYDDQLSCFCLLYDFNAEAGDSIYLPCFDVKVGVDQVDTVTINGRTRKIQTVNTNGDGSRVTVWGYNIEGIGNTVYMFPQGDMHEIGPLRCFEDSGGIHHFTSEQCDFFDSDILELRKTKFNLFPNPTNGKIYIEGNYNFIELYDITGKLLLQIDTVDKIDLGNYGNNIYFIRIIGDSFVSTEKIIVK